MCSLKRFPHKFTTASRTLFSREIELIETNLPGAWAFRSTQRAKSRYYLKLIILSQFHENTLYIQNPIWYPRANKRSSFHSNRKQNILGPFIYLLWGIKWEVVFGILKEFCMNTYFWLYSILSAHCIWFLKKAKGWFIYKIAISLVSNFASVWFDFALRGKLVKQN